jgi:peptide/nickel transport system permease protein
MTRPERLGSGAPVIGAPRLGLPHTGPGGGERIAGRWRLVGRAFAGKPMAMGGLIVIMVLFVLAYGGPVVDHWSYSSVDFNAFLQPPSAAHWVGTTQIGGDVFAQTMRGLQKSLIIGLLAGLLGTTIAAAVGAAAGYFGGWTDRTLVWFIDMLLVVPSFLFIAILSPLYKGKTWLLYVALIAVFGWMITGRIVRGLTISLGEREYIKAARYMGVPARTIIVRHVLPNIASLLIIDVALGTLLAAGQGSATTQPWLFWFAAGLLVVFSLSVNLVGDGLRDALDPTSGQAR